ncbi:MAG TPA: MlaD family protein [Solirubrobacteraceae bacterium]|nr:MlaD family protein [Solirubrobacteraceae bacterium]
MTRRRRHTALVPNWAAGIIAAVVILAVCWLVFGGPTPFGGSPYQLKAMFTAQTELHLASPVRVAGVNVGKVVSIKRVGGSSPAAVITMDINHEGLPIHTDATVNIRPRLFLEGNYYVDLSQGSPGAPILHSGQVLPAAHTSGPVQLDRVLSSLNANARTNLQTLLQGFGAALNDKPSAAADSTADPSQRGLTAAQSLNRSLDYSAAAFRESALVDQALLGETPHDLSGSVTGLSKTFTGLNESGSHLAGLVTSFSNTMGALAARQSDLSQTIALLPGTLRAADAAFGPLEASFGPTRTFARELLPGVRRLGPTITDALPWLAQARTLFSSRDLGGLLTDLTPAVQGTASTLKSTRSLLGGAYSLASCFNHTIIPTGNEKISDPPLTTGLRDYQELFQSAVGIASSAQNIDGNGRYLRSSTGGGADRVQTGSLGTSGPLYGNAVLPPLGTRPAFDGTAPKLTRSVSCLKENPPNLNATSTGAGP